MSVEFWIVAPIIGFIGMLSGGYWGVGSGWLVVPTMLILGFEPMEAVGIGLLQMVPSALPTVLRQFPEIGWGKGSPGRMIALPLAVGALLTAFAGKPINLMLFARFGSAPLDLMLIALILFIMIQTLATRTRCYGDTLPVISSRMARAAFPVGMLTGLVSSLMGVGGGILIRPLLTGGFRMPEYYTSRIVRLMVLLTTLLGGMTYLIRADGVVWSIPGAALLVAAGGMAGFPLGTRLHRIVYEAGYAQHIHKSFALIAFGLLLNTVSHLFGWIAFSRAAMLAIGVGLTGYLVFWGWYAKRRPRRKSSEA